MIESRNSFEGYARGPHLHKMKPTFEMVGLRSSFDHCQKIIFAIKSGKDANNIITETRKLITDIQDSQKIIISELKKCKV